MVRISKPGQLKYVLFRLFYALYRRWTAVVTKSKFVAHYPQFRQLGKTVHIEERVTINKPENITIGDETFIGRDTFLNAVNEISIGRYTAIAAGCRIITWNHVISDQTTELRTTGKESAPVKIGDGVWLGYDVIVLPGVTIGEGAVVAAGAVVTDDVGSFDIVGGIPAKKIGERTDEGVKRVD